MSRLVAIIGTLALHAALLTVALVSCAPPEAKAQPQKQDKRGMPAEVRLLPSEDGDGIPCDSYRGIGIKSVFGNVWEVAPGGPAARAGIRVGDVILNDSELGANRHPVGHRIVLQVQRDEQELSITVVTGHVCQERTEP